jgi:hypothetical protein
MFTAGSLPMNINSRGQFAFSKSTTMFGSTGQTGIWAQDANGQLTLVARVGDILEIAPGDLREILSMSGGVGERFISDSGQVAFRAILQDGTGIFISNRVATIPEPGSHTLFAPVLVGFARFARFRRRLTPR